MCERQQKAALISIALNAYIIKKKKRQRLQINGLSFYLKNLEKEEQFKCKVSRRKEINTRAETPKV